MTEAGIQGHEAAKPDAASPTPLEVKRKICSLIASIIKDQRLTQDQAADIMGTTQCHVSIVCAGKIEASYSIKRLMKYARRLVESAIGEKL